jgi:hypothetical protein
VNRGPERTRRPPRTLKIRLGADDIQRMSNDPGRQSLGRRDRLSTRRPLRIAAALSLLAYAGAAAAVLWHSR